MNHDPDDLQIDNFRRLLTHISETRMPFGQFGPSSIPPHGAWITDLPIEYLAWFKERGFPKSPLGELLEAVYEIKSNGMSELFVKRPNSLRERVKGKKKKREN